MVGKLTSIVSLVLQYRTKKIIEKLKQNKTVEESRVCEFSPVSGRQSASAEK